jgi:hypothetical protein
VENLAESPGMCSDGPGSAPNEIPKEGPFFERDQERERERERGGGYLGRVWEDRV